MSSPSTFHFVNGCVYNGVPLHGWITPHHPVIQSLRPSSLTISAARASNLIGTTALCTIS